MGKIRGPPDCSHLGEQETQGANLSIEFLPTKQSSSPITIIGVYNLSILTSAAADMLLMK
jgi:hypothetical protein